MPRRIETDQTVNHCGTCTMCCRLLGVAEIDKPPGVWCQHCTPGVGCRLHEKAAFPHDCAEYVCLWLQCRQENHPLPDELRPDRSKVVIDAQKIEYSGHEAHNVRCAPGYPDAWRKPPIKALIQRLRQCGSTVYLVAPSGEQKRIGGPL